MNICIVGMGAIGGLIAARLVEAGFALNCLARGETLQALRQHGLRVQTDGKMRAFQVKASDDPLKLGKQDIIIVAVKAPALAGLARQLRTLMHGETIVVPAMNGVPWWFFEGFGGLCEGLKLRTIDPEGMIAASIPTRQVLGCVVHLSATVPEPGIVRPAAGNRVIIGQPDGGLSPASVKVAEAFRRAKFDLEVCDQIQREIWFKLWGNMTMNPVSSFTGATCDRILDDELVRAFLSRCMAEAAAIGARIGIRIEADPEERHAVTRKLGAFKTSMLQDVEAGKTIELDALVSVVREIGQQLKMETPWIDTMLGLTRLFARGRGLYPG